MPLSVSEFFEQTVILVGMHESVQPKWRRNHSVLNLVYCVLPFMRFVRVIIWFCCRQKLQTPVLFVRKLACERRKPSKKVEPNPTKEQQLNQKGKNGVQRGQNGTQRNEIGAQRDESGAKRNPNGGKRGPTWSQQGPDPVRT